MGNDPNQHLNLGTLSIHRKNVHAIGIARVPVEDSGLLCIRLFVQFGGQTTVLNINETEHENAIDNEESTIAQYISAIAWFENREITAAQFSMDFNKLMKTFKVDIGRANAKTDDAPKSE